jgi:hypothetical protein
MPYSQRTACSPRYCTDAVAQRRHRIALEEAACADPVLRAAFPDEYKPAAPDDDDDDDDEPAGANRGKAEAGTEPTPVDERPPADALDAKPNDEL